MRLNISNYSIPVVKNYPRMLPGEIYIYIFRKICIIECYSDTLTPASNSSIYPLY